MTEDTPTPPVPEPPRSVILSAFLRSLTWSEKFFILRNLRRTRRQQTRVSVTTTTTNIDTKKAMTVHLSSGR